MSGYLAKRAAAKKEKAAHEKALQLNKKHEEENKEDGSSSSESEAETVIEKRLSLRELAHLAIQNRRIEANKDEEKRQQEEDAEAEKNRAPSPAQSTSQEDAEEEDGSYESFPVPAGTNPAETWGEDGMDAIVKTSELNEGIEASTYRFDGLPGPLPEDSEDDKKERTQTENEKVEKVRAEIEEARREGQTALDVANKGAISHLSMYDAPSISGHEAVSVAELAEKRRHASWPYPINFCHEMVDNISTIDKHKVRFPLEAAATKEHFYAYQSDPKFNRGLPRIFSLPVGQLCPSDNVVILSATLGKVTNTLGIDPPKATLVADTEFGPKSASLADKDGDLLYEMSDEHKELFNSPEFRRWSGIDAEFECANLREFSSKDAPVHEQNFDPSDSKKLSDEQRAALEGYICIPLVDEPRDLAQFLVLSHAAELRVAAENLGEMAILDLTFKATKEYADEPKFHGHVCVSFAALETVIEYYCAKYHPGQLASPKHTLLMMPSAQDWTDLRSLVEGEHKDLQTRGVKIPTATLRAEINVTFMPYIHSIDTPNPTSKCTKMFGAVAMNALRDPDDHEAFRNALLAAGLKGTEEDDPSRLFCLVKRKHSEMMERDRLAWQSEFTGDEDPVVVNTDEELEEMSEQFETLSTRPSDQKALLRDVLKDAKRLEARLISEQDKERQLVRQGQRMASETAGKGLTREQLGNRGIKF